ncbi:MAG TPA: arginine--tRNA ligase, partial [Armatimonadetes bacterium]|nr:arginine--tRNA ligase [Armatimonadota bacterium]
MIRKQLEEGIRRAWRAVLGERTPAEGNLFFVVERQTRGEFGDYASNVALVGAKVWGGKPRDLAEALRAAVDLGPGKIDRIEVAGPGFLNFFLHDQWLRETLREIVAQGENFGRYLGPRKGKVQVEFVSANPTGPLTVGHGRNAVLGDSIARLLEWTGWKVVREYYFNDAGRQMRLLAESVRARCGELLGRKVEFPEEGYQGQYIWDIARQLVAEEGEKVWERDWSYFKQRAEAAIFEDIKATLDRLGIRFDVFYNEQTLYDEGKVDEVIAELRRRGYVYEKEGALWFQATALGLEQDRVMVKSTGEPTYRLPDIAYHREKLRRGFDRIINVLGADHAAEAPDVLAGLRALGYDPKPIEVVFYQFVTLTRGG